MLRLLEILYGMSSDVPRIDVLNSPSRVWTDLRMRDRAEDPHPHAFGVMTAGVLLDARQKGTKPMYTTVASFLVALDETSTLGVDLDIVEIPGLFQGKVTVTPALDGVSGPGGAGTLQGRLSLERIDQLPVGVQDLQNEGELLVASIHLPALPVNTLPVGSTTSQPQESGFVASTRKQLRFRVDSTGSVNHAAFAASFRIDIEQFQATE